VAINLLKELSAALDKTDASHPPMDNAGAGIYVADAEGNLIYVNHAFVDILGYPNKDNLIGLNLAEQLYAHAEDREEFLKRIQKIRFCAGL